MHPTTRNPEGGRLGCSPHVGERSPNSPCFLLLSHQPPAARTGLTLNRKELRPQARQRLEERTVTAAYCGPNPPTRGRTGSTHGCDLECVISEELLVSLGVTHPVPTLCPWPAPGQGAARTCARGLQGTLALSPRSTHILGPGTCSLKRVSVGASRSQRPPSRCEALGLLLVTQVQVLVQESIKERMSRPQHGTPQS